jgi:dihydrolipoamide dehydrogenase
VIGAGVIGLELGSVWRGSGRRSRCSRRCRASSRRDEAVAKEAWKVFTKQGLASSSGVKIGEVKIRKGRASRSPTDARARPQTLEFDKADRRDRPRAEHRRPERRGVGLKLDERGFIEVDDDCRTNLPNVYAIGDVVRGPMLAHKAEEEGVMVAERIAGQHGHVDFNTSRG